MAYVYAGIDLGTVNSCVAVWKDGKARVIETNDGNTFPSFVKYDPTSDRIMVGSAGMADLRNLKNSVYDIKRFIGRKFNDSIVQSIHSTYPFKIIKGNEDSILFQVKQKREVLQLCPEDATSEILKYIKACLESEFTDAIEMKCVITVPAYFNNNQREATKRAAQKTGLHVLGLMKEPTAAALNFFSQNKQAKGLTVVFDFGGGTFDVSVVEKVGQDINVKCCDGDNFLGGRNVEEAIVDYLKAIFIKKNIILTDEQVRRLEVPVKQLKESLSTQENATVYVQDFHEITENNIIQLSRLTLENLSEVLFHQCLEILERCLRQNGIEKSQINNVILVGGSTKIPKIQEKIQDFFDSKPVFHKVDPDLSVALGAAIYAQSFMLNNEYTLVPKREYDLFKVNEVCSMDIGRGLIFGLFDLVIKRNTPLPVVKTVKSETSCNYQSENYASWYEGNWKCSKKNHYLGKVIFTNLPERKAGRIKFQCKIQIDLDNILTIEERVVQTNRKSFLKLHLEETRKLQKYCTWTEAQDRHFERLALIKSSFSSYYCEFAFINKIEIDKQDDMIDDLENATSKAEIIDIMENFIGNNDFRYSESMEGMKFILKSVDKKLSNLRYIKKNTKINLRT